MTSNRMYLGEKYYYPKAIKKILRVAILIDITIQIIYQTPYLSINQKNNGEKEDILITILEIIGFAKIIDYGEEDNTTKDFDIYEEQMWLVLAKAICYLFMGLQILMYSSQDFQEKYLSYIITRKEKLKRKSFMNVFRFNNKRMEIMNKSISLREEMSLSMNTLQEILEGWSNKLNIMENHQGQPPDPEIKKDELPQKGENKEDIKKENEKKEKIYNKEMVKTIIKRWILDKTLIKIESWLHRHCIDYSKIDNNEKNEYEKNMIQGKTEVKSFIENMVDYSLDMLELSDYTEAEMAQVKKYFDGTITKQLKKIEEEKELKKKEKEREMRKKSILLSNMIVDLNENEDQINIGEVFVGEDANQKVEENDKKIEKKEENPLKSEDNNDIDLTQPKFKVLEQFIKTELFQKYLTFTFALKCLLNDLITFCSSKFYFLCYLMMIIDHINNASLISIIYPLSIFCYDIFVE